MSPSESKDPPSIPSERFYNLGVVCSDRMELTAARQLLLMEDETAAALPHLRAAAQVADDDPINLFTDAQALLAIEGESHVAAADGLFKQALPLAPVGELAELIKNQQRKLADRVMHSKPRGCRAWMRCKP